MSPVEVRSPAEVDLLEAKVRASADGLIAGLAAHTGDGLSLLRRIKFDAIGRHPLQDRPLNLIEQVNQTFSMLVSLRAARLLMSMHPDAQGFRLVLGPHPGIDIESITTGLVAAEAFAAVAPDSNDKLRADSRRLESHAARHRYVFFHAPGHAEGPYRGVCPVAGVEVWAVSV